MVRKMPWSSLMRPVTTMAIATEVITDELWIIAVKSAPSRTRMIGLPILERNILTASTWAKSDMDPLIMLRPTKSIPKPVRMPPIRLSVSFLAKRATKAPMPAKVENRIVVEIELPPDIPRATIWAVTVVPILAP